MMNQVGLLLKMRMMKMIVEVIAKVKIARVAKYLMQQKILRTIRKRKKITKTKESQK